MRSCSPLGPSSGTGQALAAHQGQTHPGSVVIQGTGDHPGPLSIQRELGCRSQRTGQLHSAAVSPPLADEFGHGFLAQVAAFLELI